jgi:kinetochore protein NDC80
VGGGGNGPHQTPGKPRRGVQDTRPITDPGFKREAAQLVLKYLKDHDYPLSANLRTLLEPSGTEFASIVAFLMQQFDPSFQNHSGENCMAVSARFEDEVAMYFKFLGYPHTLSKTGMASAGSPHSWPPLLAALSWLVLVLRATEEEPDVDYLRDDPDRCNPFPQVALTQDELSNFTDKGFSQFSHDSYLFDKQKRPDLKDRVLDEFDVAIARGDELAARELEYLMLELEAVAEAVQKDRAFILEIQRMIDERDEKAEWIKDYETKTAPDHEKIMARLTKDIQDKNERLNRFNAAIRELQAKIQDVRLKVSHQTLTTQDDLKLSNRIKGLSEAIERAETQKGTVQSELDIARQELRELKRECIKTLHESFQSKLSQLEDKLPAELRAVNKISHWKKLSADDLVGDGGGAILEEIKSLGVQGKTVLENHLDSLRNKHQDVLDRLEQSVQALKESGAKKQYWYDKSDKARAVLKQETAAHRSKLEVRHIETARLEERVAHLQDPTAFEAQRVAIERRRDDLRSELAECQAKAPEWIRSVGRDIERAIDCMENLDAFFEAEVRELENYNRSMLASAATVHHPPGWKPYHLRSRAGSSSENAAIAVAPDGTDIGGAGERSARNSANDDSASLGTTRSNTKKKSSTSTGGGKKEIRRSSRRKSRL